jgi:membrane protein YdbS with pleckstrin-like domain
VNGWRRLIVRIMKVPPTPDAPPGSDAQVFRAGRNFFRYRLVGWGISQLSALIGLIFALVFIAQLDFAIPPFSRETTKLFFNGLEILGWAGFLAQIPFSLGVTYLDYEMRWYIVTDRSLRIREGIVNVKEKTMTFANIQNIQVRQGPLQRILGIADVEVRNAGGGGSSEEGKNGQPGEQVHVGYFRGLENANAVRDIILAGVRKQRHAGLGDHDEQETPDTSPDSDALAAAANELLVEAKQLRQSAAT